MEQEGQLHLETTQLEEKLTQATETFREKLHKYVASNAVYCFFLFAGRYISDVAELSKAAASAGSSEFEVMSDLRAAVDSMFQQLVATYDFVIRERPYDCMLALHHSLQVHQSRSSK